MAKFNKDSVLGTFAVIIAFCLVCSVLVSSAVVALAPFQKAAIANDKQVNVLKVSGFTMEGTVAQTYQKRIQAKLLDLNTGDFIQGDADNYNFASIAKDPKVAVAIDPSVDTAKIRTRAPYMPVYLSVDDNGNVVRYILPFYGQALWSTVYGYLSIQPDGNTVAAITFYQHGETPGLGGEIDNPLWQAKWVGKKLFDKDGQYKLTIVKMPVDKNFDIDALSGATLTGRGVDESIKYWMNVAYKPFLLKLQSGSVNSGAAVEQVDVNQPQSGENQ